MSSAAHLLLHSVKQKWRINLNQRHLSVEVFVPENQMNQRKIEIFLRELYLWKWVVGGAVNDLQWVAVLGGYIYNIYNIIYIYIIGSPMTRHNNTSRHWIIMIDFYYTESQFILLNNRLGSQPGVRLKVAKIWMKSCKEITLFIIGRVPTQRKGHIHREKETGRTANRFRIRSFIYHTVKRTHTQRCRERNMYNESNIFHYNFDSNYKNKQI